MVINFDQYKDRYAEEVNKAIGFIGKGVDFFAREKARHLVKLTERHLGNPSFLNILDLGCGIGYTDSVIVSSYNMVFGVDVSVELLKKASSTTPSAYYQVYDGLNLPFTDCFFDLVFSICVFHHILPGNHNKIIKEIKRVTKPGGLNVIFEHNPFNPLTRISKMRCEFDRDAVLLRKGQVKKLFKANGLTPLEERYIVFFPFKNWFSERIEKILWWLPLGAQYFVAAQKASS